MLSLGLLEDLMGSDADERSPPPENWPAMAPRQFIRRLAAMVDEDAGGWSHDFLRQLKSGC
jgi:hypothetical protein